MMKKPGKITSCALLYCMLFILWIKIQLSSVPSFFNQSDMRKRIHILYLNNSVVILNNSDVILLKVFKQLNDMVDCRFYLPYADILLFIVCTEPL